MKRILYSLILICILVPVLFMTSCGFADQPEETDISVSEAGKYLVGRIPYEYLDNLPESDGIAVNAVEHSYYYELLSDEEKKIYDAFRDIMKDPTTTEYRKRVETSIDPSSEVYQNYMQRAYQAVVFEHPECFWIRKTNDPFRFSYSMEPSEDGTYFIIFTLSRPVDDYTAEMEAFNNAVNAFLADIDQALTPAETVLAVHDKLIDIVNYDDDLADDVPDENDEYDHGFTAYGALVANSSGQANTAVCDGYSFAFEYLLQQLGIEVLRIGGLAGDDDADSSPHSWNLVNLDGDWYEVDCTWDDKDIETGDENGILLEAASDPYFTDRLRHYMFLKTTDEMRYFEPDDSYTYYAENGYATFLEPSVHIRYTEEDAAMPDAGDMLSAYAPYAYGVKYSYPFE